MLYYLPAMNRKKAPSELLKERLTDLNSKHSASKSFSVSDFKKEAKKVRETFEEKKDEYIQPREAL